MRYEKLAKLYDELSSTTKRLEKIDILSSFLEDLKEIDSDIIYLIEGNIYPNYDERKIGVSNQLTIKAIAKAIGTTPDKVIKNWKKTGDLGEVAQNLANRKKQTTLFGASALTTKKVIDNLRTLPELVGHGTVGKKLSLMTELLTHSTPLEALYLTRTLIGDLRIGVQESTIKYSILKAFFKNNKEYEPRLQRAIDRSNDLKVVFNIARHKKIKDLDKIKMQVGKPIKAMLAQKSETIKEAFKKLGSPMAVEYKYDGFRLLIHKSNDKVTLFTRMLENVTKQFPEVEEYIMNYTKGDSFILDSEAVGYNKKTKEYTDFQAISQRIRRKHNIEEFAKKLPVEINVFDVLYYNGESVLDDPFEERAKLVRKIVEDHKYKIIASKMIVTSDEKVVEKFYKKALKENQEGVMMKKLSAEYKPGRRVGHMLKLKPDTNELDLVITGAEWGTGKRSGWLSSLILSCKKGHKYLEIGKVGTGIAEKENDKGILTFNKLTEILKPLITEEKGRNVKIKPKIVLMIHYQDIQKSSNYESGLALRFPRVTSLREDKPLSEIATLEEIEKDFVSQRASNYRYG